MSFWGPSDKGLRSGWYGHCTLPRPVPALLQAGRSESSGQVAQLLCSAATGPPLPVHRHLPPGPPPPRHAGWCRRLPALAFPSPPPPGLGQSLPSVPKRTAKSFLTSHSVSHPSSLALPFPQPRTPGQPSVAPGPAGQQSSESLVGTLVWRVSSTGCVFAPMQKNKKLKLSQRLCLLPHLPTPAAKTNKQTKPAHWRVSLRMMIIKKPILKVILINTLKATDTAGWTKQIFHEIWKLCLPYSFQHNTHFYPIPACCSFKMKLSASILINCFSFLFTKKKKWLIQSEKRELAFRNSFFFSSVSIIVYICLVRNEIFYYFLTRRRIILLGAKGSCWCLQRPGIWSCGFCAHHLTLRRETQRQPFMGTLPSATPPARWDGHLRINKYHLSHLADGKTEAWKV